MAEPKSHTVLDLSRWSATAVAALMLALAAAPGVASATDVDDRKEKDANAPKVNRTLAEAYCLAIRDEVAEKRYAYQTARIEALRKEIDERIARLEARATEVKQWLDRRDDFSRRATERLTGIFSTMRPDAASQQLSNMDEVTAAAIVVSLEPRAAGAILSEMSPEKAARLAAIVSGAARKKPAGSGS